MSLIDMQKEVHEFTDQFNPQYWPAYEILSHLVQEVGELAREVSHMHGNEKKKFGEIKSKLGEEMADVLFTLGCLANSHDIYLEEEFQKKLDKLWKRDKDRFEKKK
jgi:NTP pyrophosphatase (non-canonical NTP hydrolase)